MGMFLDLKEQKMGTECNMWPHIRTHKQVLKIFIKDIIGSITKTAVADPTGVIHQHLLALITILRLCNKITLTCSQMASGS